ncbi:MAG: glycosyltransferase family 4 protein [Methylobacteriaceae bacterium]|nr:glycosyltransferase family 4 protein [Methylobacteriaceae bacterium]
MIAPRLLYLCFERLREGGAAATHVGEIVAGLQRRGVAVTLLAEGGEAAAGLRGQLGRYVRLTARAARALPRHDAVYVRSHFAAWPAALAARLARRPVLHEVNGTYGDAFVTHPGYRPVARLLAAAQRAQYRSAARLVAVTPDLAAWAGREAGHDRVSVVPNAANTELFRPDGPRAERPRPYAVFVGGLTRWHGVETMLAAARDPAWPDGTDLVVAGPLIDESLRPTLAAAPGNVAYLGRLPQADLPALIRGAVAALVPISDPSGRSSRGGVLPLKLYEGLACGVPAIVTDLPGQAELVRAGECGLVVPVDDPPALARAVATLPADPERARRMGEAGAALVRAEHSWDARAADTLAILDEVLRASR